MTSRRKLLVITLAVAGLLLTTGCAAENPGLTKISEQDSPAHKTLPEGVTAKGVLLAAYLLRSGDISLAVEEALVSPAEVELARQAIAENTLQDWVERASNIDK
jgi:hypothetical protein